MLRRSLLLIGLLFAGGCLWPVREQTRLTVAELALRPLDVLPNHPPPAPTVNPGVTEPPKRTEPLGSLPAEFANTDIQATSYMQGKGPGSTSQGSTERLDIPPVIPGSEASPLPQLPEATNREERRQAIQKLYPELPPLPEEPRPLAGPEGHPVTLADLQHRAVLNSPAVAQAAANVAAAEGAWIQARTYPNPTGGYQADNLGTFDAPGYQGMALNQPIKTGGKLKLKAAAAEMDLFNAKLALKRARYELATQVRQAFYAHMVARETMRVTRGLAQFTEAVYRFQTELLLSGQIAPFEPAALRAQAFTARLAHDNAIASFIFTWKELVAAVGEHQLPLTELAGRVDLFIPCFDYDTVLAHVLNNHTDIQMARNSIEKARYELKLNQIIPAYPDPNLNIVIQKDFTTPRSLVNHNVLLTMPIPIWDQNKGNILNAQGNLENALQEPQRVELMLTTELANAYMVYKTNLNTLEAYRRFILPDQVRTFRGIRDAYAGLGDAEKGFASLYNSQQVFAGFVTNYLTALGQAWRSAINVANLLQTDDLFQLARPLEVPVVPSVEVPCRDQVAETR